jgi:glycine dehydrogenase
VEQLAASAPDLIPASLRRTSAYLTHPVFNTHHSETGMLRYIRQLSDKDLALDRTMIPLGSCTMKLNATSEMIPITWPEFANVHPFAPADQLEGYRLLDEQLRAWLCQATGYAGISLQPNAGSQGEYAGLLAIKAYHAAQGHAPPQHLPDPQQRARHQPRQRPDGGHAGGGDQVRRKRQRGHGRPAGQVRAAQPESGLRDDHLPQHARRVRDQVKELCQLVHSHGGRVYVDGANMNALVGVAAPGEFGGDVSHLNLHKTFCIPHGGGGPGVGPVCVVEDLVPFLPGHATAAANGVGAVSAAPLGNAAVLPISWMYIRMMGAEGLQAATEAAILSANYISARLKDHYPTLYASANGHVAHECILDLRGSRTPAA